MTNFFTIVLNSIHSVHLVQKLFSFSKPLDDQYVLTLVHNQVLRFKKIYYLKRDKFVLREYLS